MMNYNEIIKEFSENTNIVKYLKSLDKTNEEVSGALYEKEYLPIIKEEQRLSHPFLSVIIRTQGKREEGIREALLCLNAQNNQDFEIILIAHKAEKEKKEMLRDIINEQDEELRRKIRFFELDEGSRTKPLNFGFAHAWGKYAAVFDDDDILFDDWVDAFYEAAKENDGRILHSYAFAQNWSNNEELGYRAESAPVNNYCYKFDLLSQLVVNRCPLMTLAFPVNIFQNVGIVFDENLNITEDWEYFMRLSFLCGVSDIENPTAIYRFWKNIETSATLHAQDAWKETYEEIRERFNSMDIILPANNLKRITDSMFGKEVVNLTASNGQIVSQLYYSTGNPFEQTQVVQAVNEKIIPEIDVWFVFPQKLKEITALRVDLVEEGMILISDLKIDVWFTNGEKKEVDLDEIIHTGLECDKGIWFLRDDPQLVIEMNDYRELDVVHVTGRIEHKMPKIAMVNRFINLFPLKKYVKKRILHRKGYF